MVLLWQKRRKCMDFKQLQSFVAVVQNNSFTKAAEDLYISQPTISAHIRQMEEELHTRLVLRTTKSIEITPKGKELYEYALSILELRDRMMQSCSIDNQKIIHLGASTIPSAYILPELLVNFGKKDPDTYFVIHQSDSQEIADRLKDGVFDIGFIGMNMEDESLICEPFCKDKMVIITPVNKHYLSLKKQGVDIRELLKEPVILREKGSGSKKSADYLLQSLGIQEEELKVVARVNDQEAIKNLVAGGVGISIISERAARNFINEKRLIAFELPENYAGRSLYLVYRRQYILKNEAKNFIDFVKRQYD